MKILIVEDEEELLNSITSYLKNEDFICEKATTFLEAEDKIVGFNYDIIILDIGLPDGSGLDLLTLIKQQSALTGVLIVSAKNSLDDKLAGLDLGADDYITKPFHLAELNSRINSLIRRRQFKGDEVIKFNEIHVNPNSKTVTVNNQPMELTKKEYNLLLYFITNKNKVLTKESIAEHLWGDDIEMADSFDFIYTHMGNLRKKIKKLGAPNYLRTMYGLGYKFSDK
ncbi:response regulator transcription factor [Flavobacteriaceae bacterium F08102]|nr:response regulator transcription factor [Flavobacteriaceae bacterium F08102]